MAWAIFQVTIGLFLLHTGSDSLIAKYEIPIVSIRDCRIYIIVSYLSASRDETGSYSISPSQLGMERGRLMHHRRFDFFPDQRSDVRIHFNTPSLLIIRYSAAFVV